MKSPCNSPSAFRFGPGEKEGQTESCDELPGTFSFPCPLATASPAVSRTGGDDPGNIARAGCRPGGERREARRSSRAPWAVVLHLAGEDGAGGGRGGRKA